MSKNVKYISSSHYGAPIMKGDRWGYLVEMLRTTLVTGFNERIDLKSIIIHENDKIVATFDTEHNYSVNQTITISNVEFPEINGEYVIDSESAFTVTCIKCEKGLLTGLVGQTINGVYKSIVSPLGFVEKYTDAEGRSVFTTDQEECFLYIDDRQPSGWKNESGNTGLICPIVFMTDKMTDINTTVGKFIVPYQSANPNYYKENGYAVNGYLSMGLWNWLTFGVNTTSSDQYSNTPTIQQKVHKWTIIGNGRFFYFISNVENYNNGSVYPQLYCFGKFDGVNSIKNKNYVLFANNYCDGNAPTTAYRGSFSPYRVSAAFPYNNSYLNNDVNVRYNNTDLGRVSFGILSISNKSTTCIFTPSPIKYGTTSVIISGGNGYYPDLNTKKFNVSKIKIFDPSSYTDFGVLSGLFWTYNPSMIYNANGKIIKYKYNNIFKRLYNINTSFKSDYYMSISSSNTSNFIYNISLEYEDWNNYE